MAESAKKRSTMKDVAKRVGVSVQTVSAVINQKEGITEKTRERVLRAVEELNYRPYSVARSLRTGQSHTLALLITDIANPYLASIVSTAEEYAYQHGYTLTVYNTHELLVNCDMIKKHQYGKN